MHVTIAVALALLAADPASAIGLRHTTPSPSQIAELSLAGDDDSPAMPLRIYHLLPPVEGVPQPTVEEIELVVRELFFADENANRGVYLRAAGNHLIVRHEAVVHHRVLALLRELGVVTDSATRRGGGFRCGWTQSVIPVVGERSGARRQR